MLQSSLLPQRLCEKSGPANPAHRICPDEAWYRERIAPPPEAVIEAVLLDISRVDAGGSGARGWSQLSMCTARPIIAGYENFAMIRKGQVATIPANDMGAQSAFIGSLFAIAA